MCLKRRRGRRENGREEREGRGVLRTWNIFCSVERFGEEEGRREEAGGRFDQGGRGDHLVSICWDKCADNYP